MGPQSVCRLLGAEVLLLVLERKTLSGVLRIREGLPWAASQVVVYHLIDHLLGELVLRDRALDKHIALVRFGDR